MCLCVFVCVCCVCTVGLHVVQVVAGPRFSTSPNEGFALALVRTGEVYCWGRSINGRLGISGSETVRSPMIVEPLVGKNIKMVSLK